MRSYYSKNRKRLDFDRITAEADARASGVDVNVVSAQQVTHLPSHGYALHALHGLPFRERGADAIPASAQ